MSFRVNGWFIQVDGVGPGPANASEEEAEETVPQIALAERPDAPEPGSQTLSRYDGIIHRHASAQGLDWRLVAALIFEESRFQPDSQSDAGAYGLMQIRPIAAESVGSRRYREPDDNIQTGVRYLKQLEEMFEVASGRDRLALVLAAYNMGPGHLHDAQMLARRFGYDPYCWDDSMSAILPLLEDPQFNQRLVNGFAKGRQTVGYVDRILARYERYKLQASEWPAFGAAAPQAASANG